MKYLEIFGISLSNSLQQSCLLLKGPRAARSSWPAKVLHTQHLAASTTPGIGHKFIFDRQQDSISLILLNVDDQGTKSDILLET